MKFFFQDAAQKRDELVAPASARKEYGTTLISFSEEYQKARRASLTWSSLTSIAAFGSTNVAQGAFTINPLGLSFEKTEIICAFLFAAIFYFVSYWRYSSRLSRLNTSATQASSFDSLSEVIEQSRTDVRTLIGRIASFQKEKEVYMEALHSSAIRLDHYLDRILEAIEDERRWSPEPEKQLKEACEGIKRLEVPDAPISFDQIMRELDQVKLMSEELTSISDRFEEIDRRWHFVLDHGAVLLLFFVAVSFSVYIFSKADWVIFYM